MFSKRLSAADSRPALPAEAAMFRANINFVDMLDRFREARVSNTAHRTLGVLADTDTLMQGLEASGEHSGPELAGFVSLGIGRAVNALRDELNAQRGFIMHLADDDSGSARLLRQRFAESFEQHITAVRELGHRMHTQLERFGMRLVERAAEKLEHLAQPGRDEPILLEGQRAGVADAPDQGDLGEMSGLQGIGQGIGQSINARLQVAADRERDGTRRSASELQEEALRIARDRRDRLMHLLATIEQESVVMLRGDREAARQTLSRLAQPGELNLSVGDMQRIEDVEEELRERF